MREENKPEDEMEFSNNWFGGTAEKIWKNLLPQLRPQKILEVGSYEGRSACYLICNNDWSDNIELHCVDTWEGGIEHKSANINMNSVEERFEKNTGIALSRSSAVNIIKKHKGFSLNMLAELISSGFTNYFDFIYVDGSHQAPDVISDAVLCFNLLRVGGVMGFDDYTWGENLPYGKDPIRCPKISIDAFTTIFARKVRIINTPNYQLYTEKVAD